MNKRAALALLADRLPAAGDDAAVLDGLVLTTDMLHERTDFPTGTTRYTAGWRAVSTSLLCNEKKIQREVADTDQMTEVTIRNRYQEQIEAMGIHI